MREINLQEWQRSAPVTLTVAERDALRQAVPLDAIDPVPGKENGYHLRPGSTIGAVQIGDLSVLIAPKIPIPQVLSLACYAIGKVKLQAEDFNLPERPALPDALALALTHHARRAFVRGLLHGYRTEEEALYTVRGRIRFDEQLRRRFSIPLPVAVQYDEFTDDVPANQLVKAATYRLGRASLHSAKARQELGWLAAMLESVSLQDFPTHNVPAVRYDRLNEHYRGVVELSRLILRHGAFQSDRGAIRARGFLMDMNVVFQEFVTVALREKLGLSERSFPAECRGRNVRFDDTGRIKLEPDLSWWDGRSCVFVGDAKYKNLTGNRVPNADLYQMLAYVTALNLPGGLLIYAHGEADAATYHIHHANKRLQIAALDLSGALEDVLTRVSRIADQIKTLRASAPLR